MLSKSFVVAIIMSIAPAMNAHSQPSNWIQVGSDIDGDNLGDASGFNVSLSESGTLIAVGAPQYGNSGAGYARVYSLAGGVWSPLGNDIVGEAATDGAGNVVALSADGSVMAVAATFHDGANGTDSGHVRVFAFDGSSWNQLGGDIEGEAPDDQLGWFIDISSDGTVLAVGSIFNDAAGLMDSGHVRVFEFDGSSWNQRGSDIDGDEQGEWLGFGLELSSDGSRLAIGAPLDSGNGVVRVFDFNGLDWEQVGNDISRSQPGALEGYAVSLSSDGSTLAVGSRGAGRTAVYALNQGVWQQLGADIDDESPGDASGHALSLSSDGATLAIGAIGNSGGGFQSGHVRVYDFIDAAWIQRGDDIDGEAAGDQSGFTVRLSADGSALAVGTPRNGGVRGHVRIFSVDTDGDGFVDIQDNCPTVANADQIDANSDGFGDACVNPTVALADSVEVGVGVVLEEGVSVAKNSVIEDNVTVGENTAVGKGSVIGADTEVGDNTEVRKDTAVGANVYIGQNVTIAKGVEIGENVRIGDGTTIRKGVIIGDNVDIGADVFIEQNAIIPDGSSVPANAVVASGETFGA